METKIIYRYPLGNPRRKYRQDNLVISTFKAYTGNIRLGSASRIHEMYGCL